MKTNAKLHGLSVLLLAAALLTSGCASHSYMGVSLKPGGADPAVQALAARASIGDKQAQYELGRWFEDSTDSDGLKKAIKLYRIAASDSGGSRLLLVPSSSGLTTSVVGMGPKIAGNAAAQTRLQQLTLGREMKQDHVQSGIGVMANHTIENKDISMIGNLNKLANIPAGTLKVSDVSEIFGMVLTKTKSDDLGEIYSSDVNQNQLNIKLYVFRDNEIRLNLSGLQVERLKLDKSIDFLLKNNWVHYSSIRQYIFVETFYDKNEIKQIRLESNGENLREISMFGLNVEGVD